MNNYIYKASVEVGLERFSSAVVFGKILQDYKNNDRTLTDVVDTLLTITTLDRLQQLTRDYKKYIRRL